MITVYFGPDEMLRQLEREYKNARAKYNRAKKSSVKYNIQNCNDHNMRVRAIVELRVASEGLSIALNNYNSRRAELGMKQILVEGINK